MFYKGFDKVGEYCGKAYYHGEFIHNSPWGIVLLILGALLLVTVTVLIIRSINKNNNGTSDMIALLKSKFAAGEIDEEEYIKKRNILKK